MTKKLKRRYDGSVTFKQKIAQYSPANKHLLIMTKLETPKLVSIHGGHSGEFCNHAQDSLEDTIQAYIDRGFSWVGITEHVPPVSNDFLYPEEVEAKLTAKEMYARFAKYVAAGRNLQRKYAAQLEISVGFETETYAGYQDFMPQLVKTFKPDYIVGSIHHIDNIPIDFSEGMYGQAVQHAGGLDSLYCRYFDQQLEMIKALRPQVVGHFDLVRKYDPDYRQRLQKPELFERVKRNLIRIKELNLILDFNVRALLKGANEPYPTKSILLEAKNLDIPVVPGDDSHSAGNAGLNIEKAIAILQDLGFDTNWAKPRG